MSQKWGVYEKLMRSEGGVYENHLTPIGGSTKKKKCDNQ